MNLNAQPRFAYVNPVLDKPYLMITDHHGIAPLDAQFGMFPKLDFPSAAEEALLGGNEDSLFVLLDGALVPSLEERIEAEGLISRSLFAGRAEEEYREVAPRLVQLRRGSSLLRSLFTDAGRPSDLWRHKPGLFLQSKVSIDTLRAHLRRFTRVQDADGKWFYFRMHDAESMNYYFAMKLPVLENLSRFFEMREGGSVTWILPIGERLRVVRNRFRYEPRGGSLRLSAEEFDAFRLGKWHEFLMRVEDAIRAEHPALDHHANDIPSAALEGFSNGFRVEKALYLFILSNLMCRSQSIDYSEILREFQSGSRLSEMDLAETFHRRILEMVTV